MQWKEPGSIYSLYFGSINREGVQRIVSVSWEKSQWANAEPVSILVSHRAGGGKSFDLPSPEQVLVCWWFSPALEWIWGQKVAIWKHDLSRTFQSQSLTQQHDPLLTEDSILFLSSLVRMVRGNGLVLTRCLGKGTQSVLLWMVDLGQMLCTPGEEVPVFSETSFWPVKRKKKLGCPKLPPWLGSLN